MTTAGKTPSRALLACALFALVTLAFPLARARLSIEIDYDEGWNVFNAATVAAHRWLYAEPASWTAVNYPMGWFALLAGLHRWTGDYLFTGRVLSLVGLAAQALLVCVIARRLGAGRPAAWIAFWLTVAVFATCADDYVGMNDPQMFAESFYLAGLLVYVTWRQSWTGLAAAAALFALGGMIKHSPIDFPLAVLLDLLLVARWRAAWFAFCGLALAGLVVWLNLRFGGPYFLDQLLGARTWSATRALVRLASWLGPLLPLIGLALFSAFSLRHDPEKRIAALLLANGLCVGSYFSGGAGVSINALFPTLIAMVLLLALAGWRLEILFGWLLVPWLLPGEPIGRYLAVARQEARVTEEVSLLRSVPGPVLCESLLACYWADKPYLLDPFNAARLIRAGKLDGAILIGEIRERRFGAVQLYESLETPPSAERWTPDVLAEIGDNYTPALANEDGVIYLPKP